MTHAPDTSVTAQLLGLETTKTWSLIATIFGDLEEEQVSGKELWTLLEPLGIKPEAMRVALHRLKKDGWIVSEKKGREVVYRLSNFGRRETHLAQSDVYRHDVKFSDGWRLVLLAPDTRPLAGPHVRVDKNLCLVPVSVVTPMDGLEMSPVPPIPAWFEARLVPDHVIAQANCLVEFANVFLQGKATERTSVTARVMFLHYWRRMALRTGVWAHIGLFPSGVMAKCHAAMTQIFDQTRPTKPIL